MTLETTINRVSKSGNGVTTAFPFANKFFTKADLKVYLVNKETGEPTPQVLTTNYTVSGTTDDTGAYPNGGTVNMNVAPSSAYNHLIIRDPAPVQSTNHIDNDPLPAKSIDNPLDLLTAFYQRVLDRLAFVPSAPDTDPLLDLTLPTKIFRAGKYGAYDLNGLPTALAGLGLTDPDEPALFVYAQNFGVLANNGVDYSDELQAAEDAAEAVGKALKLPDGTILGTFKYGANASIFGGTANTTTLQLPDGANRNVIESKLWGRYGPHRVTGYANNGAGAIRLAVDSTDGLVTGDTTRVRFVQSTRTITGAADNGAGLVRLTMASTTGLGNGRANIAGIVGTTEANGWQTIAVIDGTHVDVAVDFVHAYVSGGTLVSLSEANGTHTYTVIDGTHVDLVGTTYLTPFSNTAEDPMMLAGTTDGSTFAIIADMTLDGNMENNTKGSLLCHYGDAPTITRLRFTNAPESHLKSFCSHSVLGTPHRLGPIGHISHLMMDTAGEHCFVFGGPIDSNISFLSIVDGSRKTDGTYDGFHIVPFDGNGRYSFVHVFNRLRSEADPLVHNNWHRYAVYDGRGASQHTAGYYEGAYTNVYATSSCVFDACTRLYAPKGGINMILAGNSIIFQGVALGAAPADQVTFPVIPDSVAFQIGTDASPSGLHMISGFSSGNDAGIVDFTHSTGHNIINLQYFQIVDPLIIGTPLANDDVYIHGNTRGSYTFPIRQANGGIRLIKNTTPIEWQYLNGAILQINGVLNNLYGHQWSLYASDLGQGLSDADKTLYYGSTGTIVATVSTLYYIYAIINSFRQVALIASTTAHEVGPTTGLEVMIGHEERTLVGMAYTGSVAGWEGVASWYNRRPVIATAAFTADRTLANNTLTEINTEIRVPFMSWGDGAVAAFQGVTSNATLGKQVQTSITADGVSTILGSTIGVSPAANDPIPSGITAMFTPTEGRHYATIAGRTDATPSTGKWQYANPSNALSVMTVS